MAVVVIADSEVSIGRRTSSTGSWSPQRCIILECPDEERSQTRWDSPEYAPLRALGQRATKSNMVVTQGL
jgi:uncharacterized protein (DUF1330 family)